MSCYLSIHNVSDIDICKTEIQNEFGKSYAYLITVKTSDNNQDFVLKLFSKEPDLKIKTKPSRK